MNRIQPQLGLLKHLSIFLCLKYLRSKKIVILSITAIAMSCSLLIAMASLFTAFIAAVENSATDHLGDIVISSPASFKIPKYESFIESLESSDSIEAATAVLTGQGLLHIGAGDVRAVQIWGVQMPKRASVTPFSESLIIQKNRPGGPVFDSHESPDKCGGFVGIAILGGIDSLTDEYDFDSITERIGQKAVLTTGTFIRGFENSEQETSQVGNFKPKSIKFTITDAVYTGVYDSDKHFVYLPIDTLNEKLYPSRAKVADMINIKIKENVNPETALAIVRGMWRNFAAEKLNWSNYLISQVDIDTSMHMQSRLISEYRKQLGILMLIFGVVSAGTIILISCIFYLIVTTKQKDIAIVKSCGLGSAAVAVLFVTFGMISGLVGSGFGILTGYLVTMNANEIERWINVIFGLKLWKSSTYMFSKIPTQMNWECAAWVALAAVIAAGIGSLIPAIAAGRVKPVEILRYE